MNLPYKYRGFLQLALLVLFLPWAAWRFALGDTFRMWRDCRQLAARFETLAPAIGQRAFVVAQDRELILSGELLDAVRMIAGKLPVHIVGYEPLVTMEQEGLAIHTARLVLTGGYSALVKVVDSLERTLPGCRMSSLEWQAKNDRRMRCTELNLTLYIQQIRLKK